MRVFKNSVLRRIFGCKRDDITGEWRRLHNVELYDMFSSPNIIRVIRLGSLRGAGHVARMGKRRGLSGFWWGNVRPRYRWEYNIKMDLREVGWRMDWTDAAQGRDKWQAVVNAVMNLWVA
jgi:hypothetical protein